MLLMIVLVGFLSYFLFSLNTVFVSVGDSKISMRETRG